MNEDTIAYYKQQYGVASADLQAAKRAGDIIAQRNAISRMRYWSNLEQGVTQAGLGWQGIFTDAGRAIADAVVKAPETVIRGAGEVGGSFVDAFVAGVLKNPLILLGVVGIGIAVFGNKR